MLHKNQGIITPLGVWINPWAYQRNRLRPEYCLRASQRRKSFCYLARTARWLCRRHTAAWRESSPSDTHNWWIRLRRWRNVGLLAAHRTRTSWWKASLTKTWRCSDNSTSFLSCKIFRRFFAQMTGNSLSRRPFIGDSVLEPPAASRLNEVAGSADYIMLQFCHLTVNTSTRWWALDDEMEIPRMLRGDWLPTQWRRFIYELFIAISWLCRQHIPSYGCVQNCRFILMWQTAHRFNITSTILVLRFLVYKQFKWRSKTSFRVFYIRPT